MKNDVIIKLSVIFFIILIALLLIPVFNKENNNITKDIIEYIIEQEPMGNKEPIIYNTNLYVNSKLVNLRGYSASIKVNQLSDILIVEQSNGSSNSLYAVDKNANVIGVFAPNSSDFKNVNILLTKFYYRDTYKVGENNLYIQTDSFSNSGPEYMLCNVYKDDDIVLYEEKFEYLGNNKFSNPIITKQVTRKQYMQEHNITCNQSSTNKTISYKIEKGTHENEFQDSLYVNDKLVDFKVKNTCIKVKQLKDILIAEVDISLSPRMLYAVDKDANIIGVFTPNNNDYFKNVNIIPTKLYYTGSYEGAYRIDDNSLYIQTQLGQTISYPAVCNNIDNDIVLYEEKFEYLGNNKFSEPTITKQMTKKQYAEQKNINCSSINNTNEVLITKVSPNTIKFYINGKEKGEYVCNNEYFCDYCNNPYLPSIGFFSTNDKIYNTGLAAIYENGTSIDTTKVVIFDIYNNKAIANYDSITDSYNLDNHIIIKNSDNKFAVVDWNGNYIKKYSDKEYDFKTTIYDHYDIRNDRMVFIKNNKYGIEKISEDKIITENKYDEISLTDGLVVADYNHINEEYYDPYENKYFKAKIGDKWYLYYLDTDKKVIDKGYDRLYLIDENTIVVYEDGKISFIDYQGNYLLKEKIEVYISSERFYKSPEGIRFIINGNVVSIYIDIEGSTKRHQYEYNLQTKKITKLD